MRWAAYPLPSRSLKRGKSMKKYELVIIWETGEKEVHEYESQQLAEQAERGYKKAFGNQIQWSGTRPKR